MATQVFLLNMCAYKLYNYEKSLAVHLRNVTRITVGRCIFTSTRADKGHSHCTELQISFRLLSDVHCSSQK